MWTVLWKNQWRNVCRFHTPAFLKAFEKSNSPKDKLSLQDSDSLQKNGKPNNGMYKVGVKKFSIPGQSFLVSKRKQLYYHYQLNI